MRHLLWVLLAGLLATTIAQVQNQGKSSTSTVIHLITKPFNRVQNRGVQEERLAAIARLAADSADIQQTPEVVVQEEASHKTAQGVLQAVEDIVAALTPDPPIPEATSDSGQTNDTVVETSESIPSETEEETPTETSETVLTEASEAVVLQEEEETATEASEAEIETPEEEQPEEVAARPLTKKERKAIRKYNTAVDQVLVILSKKLNEVGPIPIALDEESLLALDEEEEEPLPETTPSSKNTNTKRNKKKKNRKNNKGKSGQRKNNNSAEKGNKKNKNKNNNNNNARRRKNRNNKNQRNNNKRNNRRNKNDASQLKREPKALGDDEEMTDAEQGRRKNSQVQTPGNKRRANKRKTKNNKRNRKDKNKNKGRMDMESRIETGPSLPTDEEMSQSNARLTGLSKLTRNGDVTVELSSKKIQIDADITIGPLEVNLKDRAKALTKAQVSTSLAAVASFKVRSVRGRHKIQLRDIQVSEIVPDDVAVTRSDMDLEPEVVTLAQQQVVAAMDTARLGRILDKVLTNIFDKDNIVENLDSHPLL